MEGPNDMDAIKAVMKQIKVCNFQPTTFKFINSMGELRTLAEHTVDISLLARDSKVLDCGSRYFGWSEAMLEFVDKVECIDADNEVISTNDRLPIHHYAITSEGNKAVTLCKIGNGTGNFIVTDKRPAQPYKKGAIELLIVGTITIQEAVQKLFRQDLIDLIKLDIEGEEVPALLSLTSPPAKQITCEFHMHTGTTKDQVEAVIKHLEQWYEVAFCDYSRKHGLPENYWDVLFIKR